jgi:hypothetical protein
MAPPPAAAWRLGARPHTPTSTRSITYALEGASAGGVFSSLAQERGRPPFSPAGASTLTSVSHRLVANLRPDEPIAKVLLELLGARQARGADGGLFTVIFATALLRGSADSGLPPRVLAALLPEALL